MSLFDRDLTSDLDIDTERTRALARDLRSAAADTPLPAYSLPPLPGPTAVLASSLDSALGALHRRSRIVASHLDALSTDAETFASNVRTTDSSLGGAFGVTL